MTQNRVGLLGATGETGTSILNGLIGEGGFDIVALVRPTSLYKPANVALEEKGIELRALDLEASQDSIVTALKDIDILLSAIGPEDQLAQISLATAAKHAGVKRFVPCGYMTVTPVGVHMVRDQKEEVYNFVKRLHLPYTIIDVGWWYQLSFPELPSGKIDYAIGFPGRRIPGDGNVPSAITDLRDIGKYVARVIKDERTLNTMVFVYNELWTVHQIYDLVEELSGEKIPRKYISAEECERQIAEVEAKPGYNPKNAMANIQKINAQYYLSWGIRGDNSPENAKYLGYLDGKKLYPDLAFNTYKSYIREVLSGQAPTIYGGAIIDTAKA